MLYFALLIQRANIMQYDPQFNFYFVFYLLLSLAFIYYKVLNCLLVNKEKCAPYFSLFFTTVQEIVLMGLLVEAHLGNV